MKNKKPAPIKLKPIIKGHIKTFLSMFRPGDQLRSDDICSYVRRMTGRQHYPDTILRYLRELRNEGILNYTCTLKRDRIIKIIAIGQPHSL